MLLKGVIDCPDLPLNVSRSALQNDGFVKKISDYITKKVADKLSGLCKTDHESYEKYWDDISPFIKYGCLKDDKFCDKMNDYILFKDIYDKYTTLPDLLKKEEKPEDATEEKKDENTASDSEQNAAPEEEKDTRKSIYYVTDLLQQSQYIQLFKEQKQNAVILDKVIDTSFISQLEQRNPDYKFLRIDADLTDSLVENDGADLKADTDTLSEIFKKAIANDKLTINVMKIKNKDTAAILNVSEEMRRMQDMMKMYSMNGSGMDASMFAAPETLVLNDDHELVRYIIDHKDSDLALDFAKQIYDMAKLANAPLDANQMTEFLKRSNKIMLALANK
jgi:molecular chaperone HtpG